MWTLLLVLQPDSFSRVLVIQMPELIKPDDKEILSSLLLFKDTVARVSPKLPHLPLGLYLAITASRGLVHTISNRASVWQTAA